MKYHTRSYSGYGSVPENKGQPFQCTVAKTRNAVMGAMGTIQPISVKYQPSLGSL